MNDFLTYLRHFAEQATNGQFNQRAEFAPNGDEALAELVAAADKLNADGHRVNIVSHRGDLWADCLTPKASTAGWYGRHHQIHTQP